MGRMIRPRSVSEPEVEADDWGSYNKGSYFFDRDK